ncbi:MAG: hypothetical protein ACRENO_05590 [Thermodesulfobacteriota bacterium]
METTRVKDQAKLLIEELSDDASWDDLMYKIYVIKAIDSGLKDSEKGQTHELNEVRSKFGPK